MESTGERFIPDSKGIIELEHLNRYYFVVNQIDLKDKVVLDIASGEGYGSNILSKFAHKVIGVDISNEAIAHAKKKYEGANLNYIQGNAVEIPLEDESIDVVVSFETIEHHDKHIEMIKEIKRVLKKDWILIISSPDKKYYSDLPKYKNEFHVKELYYDEFRLLIKSNFDKIYFFSQRTFGGSIIALDEAYKSYNKPLVVEQSGENHSFLPLYNIAIATNNSKYEISEQLVFYTENNQAITQQDIDSAIYFTKINLQKTKTYRLGKFILGPLRNIRKFFSKK